MWKIRKVSLQSGFELMTTRIKTKSLVNHRNWLGWTIIVPFHNLNNCVSYTLILRKCSPLQSGLELMTTRMINEVWTTKAGYRLDHCTLPQLELCFVYPNTEKMFSLGNYHPDIEEILVWEGLTLILLVRTYPRCPRHFGHQPSFNNCF